MGDLCRLIVKNGDVDTRWFIGGHLLKSGFEGMPHVNDIDPGDKGDPHGYRLAAVGMIDTGGRVGQPARQRGNIPQSGGGAGAMRADQKIPQFIDILKLPGGVKADRFAAGADLPGAGYHVEPGQDSGKLVKRNTARGHFRQRDINIDLLWNRAANGDFADARHQHQLTAQLLGIAHQLRIGKTVARNGEEKAKHIAKVIIDEGGDYPRGKKPAGVTDAATQLIPDLRQFAGMVLRSNIHCNLR